MSQHVRDLMRKARESPEFRFSAAPVVSRPKKTAASSSSAATASAKNEPRTPSTGKVKEKIKIKLTPASSAASRRAAAASANSKQASPKKRGGAAAANKTNSRATKVKIKEEPESPRKETSVGRRKRGAPAASNAASLSVEEDAMPPEFDTSAVEETTVKEKWLKLYHDKYRAVDEARFRAIQVCLLGRIATKMELISNLSHQQT